MSREQAIQLGKVLWDIANKLRGAMDADQFRDYMLGFIFFKYLSENFEEMISTEFGFTLDSLMNVYENHPDQIALVEHQCTQHAGYMIPPKFLWANFAKRALQKDQLLDDLKHAFRQIETSTVGQESAEDIGGLFSEIDMDSAKLGKSYEERNKIICEIINTLDSKLTTHDLDKDDLGDAYEYLIAEFAASSGKKAGEFYTPQKVSTILSKIVTLDVNGTTIGTKKRIESIYDPTCGSGSLLFNVYKEIRKNGGEVDNIYGQDKNLTTYNLARMNLLLHRIPFSKFHVQHGDTLLFPALGKKQKIEAIVANPPFSFQWDSSSVINDDRFTGYPIPPKSTADFAFVLHMIHHLADHGTCAVVVPHGVLFRSGAEQKIREILLSAGETNNGYLDAVIGLPSNLFYSTGIPVCILVFKKCRNTDDILFIDASKEFEKEKKQNILTEEHIEKIVNTYAKRAEIEKYSKRIQLQQIQENNYNLNIPRYVDSSEDEIQLNYIDIVAQIKQIQDSLDTNHKRVKSFCDELGIECW